MDIGKYKKAMRPKKYLDGDFVVYDPSLPDPSDVQLETRDTFSVGGESVIREEFSEGTKTELVEFVEKFKSENNRIPTQTEIVRGTGKAAKTVKSYLKEGVDYAKLLTPSESAKLGGRQPGKVKEIDQKAFQELKDLTRKIKGISIQITGDKSKSVGLRIGKQYQPIMDEFTGGQVTKYFPGDEKGIQQLRDLIIDIAESNVYKDNVTPFQSPDQKRAIKRAKAATYREKDPFNVYRRLQEYKTEKFPELSREIQIQHGQPKFTTQTLSRFGLIPQSTNVNEEIQKIEGIRNNEVKILNSKLKNPNTSIEDKKQIIEEFNNKMKGLRGQLKGTPAQGLVNFELYKIDDSGSITKLKDTGFDPKKGMAYGKELGELDLSKITKEQADEIIALGKKKITTGKPKPDFQGPPAPGTTTAPPTPTGSNGNLAPSQLKQVGVISNVDEYYPKSQKPNGSYWYSIGWGRAKAMLLISAADQFLAAHLSTAEQSERARTYHGNIGTLKLNVRPDGGHYTLITIETDQVTESEVDKLAKRLLGLVHKRLDPSHQLRGAY